MTSEALLDQLLQRLNAAPADHERFTGKPLEIAGLTPLELGRLWPAIRRLQRSEENPAARALAESIQRQAREMALTPVFDEATSLALFRGRQACSSALAALRRGPVAADRRYGRSSVAPLGVARLRT